MLVASFMRSAQGLTLYSLDGDTKNLNATDFDLPEVFVALKHLIETGDPVEIDYEGFRILKTLAAIRQRHDRIRRPRPEDRKRTAPRAISP